jgi:hypothetical protein
MNKLDGVLKIFNNIKLGEEYITDKIQDDDTDFIEYVGFNNEKNSFYVKSVENKEQTFRNVEIVEAMYYLRKVFDEIL